MAIRPVLRIGEPSLLDRSIEVEKFDSSELNDLLTDMWDTMAEESGAGLAAPQIGVNLRVVIFGYEHNPRYPEAPAVSETVLINPQITALDDEIEFAWEGCLSVPGMRGLVPRYRHIRYQGFDQSGQPCQKFAFIGMSGETADLFNFSPHFVFLPQYPNTLCPVHDYPAKGIGRLISHKKESAFRARDVGCQMMLDSAAGTHS